MDWKGYEQHIEESWRWFESVGKPKFWLAPMVGQSECAFRMLCRKYGANMCSTEMIDAGGYARSEQYRSQYPFHPEDRPLILQLGGSNPDDISKAAAFAAPFCDAVELNIGCPQRCARKAGYGAYLMERPEQLRLCVEALASAVRAANPKAACLCKIRCFDDPERTVQLAAMLVRAGCHCLTVHGRTRDQGGGKRTGRWPANWAWVRSVKQALPIPVVSNGNIRHHADLLRSLRDTAADAAMTGCGALRRPWIFSPRPPQLPPPPLSRTDDAALVGASDLHISVDPGPMGGFDRGESDNGSSGRDFGGGDGGGGEGLLLRAAKAARVDDASAAAAASKVVPARVAVTEQVKVTAEQIEDAVVAAPDLNGASPTVTSSESATAEATTVDPSATASSAAFTSPSSVGAVVAPAAAAVAAADEGWPAGWGRRAAVAREYLGMATVWGAQPRQAARHLTVPGA